MPISSTVRSTRTPSKRVLRQFRSDRRSPPIANPTTRSRTANNDEPSLTGSSPGRTFAVSAFGGLAIAASGLALVRHRARRLVPVVIAGVAVLTATFTGFLLPWDQLALNQVTVGTNVTGYRMILFDSNVKYVLIGNGGSSVMAWRNRECRPPRNAPRSRPLRYRIARRAVRRILALAATLFGLRVPVPLTCRCAPRPEHAGAPGTIPCPWPTRTSAICRSGRSAEMPHIKRAVLHCWQLSRYTLGSCPTTARSRVGGGYRTSTSGPSKPA